MSWIPSGQFRAQNTKTTRPTIRGFPTAPHALPTIPTGRVAMPSMSAPATMQIILTQTASGWRMEIGKEVSPPPPQMREEYRAPPQPIQPITQRQPPPVRRPTFKRQTPDSTKNTDAPRTARPVQLSPPPTHFYTQVQCTHCTQHPNAQKEVRFAQQPMGPSTRYRTRRHSRRFN